MRVLDLLKECAKLNVSSGMQEYIVQDLLETSACENLCELEPSDIQHAIDMYCAEYHEVEDYYNSCITWRDVASMDDKVILGVLQDLA